MADPTPVVSGGGCAGHAALARAYPGGDPSRGGGGGRGQEGATDGGGRHRRARGTPRVQPRLQEQALLRQPTQLGTRHDGQDHGP